MDFFLHFYSTINNSGIQRKIEEWNYIYGDVGWNLVQNENITTEEAYKIETGKTTTQYYNASGELITNETWTKGKQSKIALMYIHDYAYSGSKEGHNTSCRTDYEITCKGSWMHITKNGGSESEWMMTRTGPMNSNSDKYYSWVVSSSGDLFTSNQNAKLAIRPVFYLKKNIGLKGSGTIDDPFYIVS